MKTDELILWCVVGFGLGMMSDEDSFLLMAIIFVIALTFRLSYS